MLKSALLIVISLCCGCLADILWESFGTRIELTGNENEIEFPFVFYGTTVTKLKVMRESGIFHFGEPDFETELYNFKADAESLASTKKLRELIQSQLFLTPFYTMDFSKSSSVVQHYSDSLQSDTKSRCEKLIRSTVPSSEEFVCTKMLMITFIVQDEREEFTNTYQVLLATHGEGDDMESHVLVNYVEITRAYGYHLPKDEYYGRAGINVDGILLEFPYSGTENMGTIAQELARNVFASDGSSSDGPYGVLVYKTSLKKPALFGSCNVNSTLLQIIPNKGYFLGGNVVHLRGPCMWQQVFTTSLSSGVIKEMACTRIDSMSATCVMPNVRTTSGIKISVDMHSNTELKLKQPVGWYFPTTTMSPVHIMNMDDWLNPVQPGSQEGKNRFLELHWTSEDLGIGADTENALVDIKLWVYKERHGQRELSLVKFMKTVPSPAGMNSFKLNVNDTAVHCASSECKSARVGVIQLVPSSQTTNKRNGFSQPFLLTWFYSFVEEDKNKGVARICTEALDAAESQQIATIIAANAEVCPCSRQMAWADLLFSQEATDSNDEKTPHCFRSKSRVGKLAADSQCCYRAESGEIVYHQNLEKDGLLDFASIPNSSPMRGQFPFTEARQVPLFSHLANDVVLRQSCCDLNFANKSLCEIGYRKARPTVDCSLYNTPGIAFVYGLGHVSTFHGSHLWQMGIGEYWLVKGSDTGLQARYGTVLDKDGSDTGAAAITTVVMFRQDKGVYKRLQIGLSDGSTGDKLDVIVNGQKWYYAPNNIENEAVAITFSDKTNVTISMPHSVIRVVRTGNALSVHAQFMGLRDTFQGILGAYSKKEGLNLQMREGTDITEEDLYTATTLKTTGFFESWRVNEDETQFYYANSETYESMQKPLYKPDYEKLLPPPRFRREEDTEENLPITDDMLRQMNQDASADTDFYITGDEEMKAGSDIVYSEVVMTREALDSDVALCPLLEKGVTVTASSGAQYVSQRVGSTVDVSCANSAHSLTDSKNNPLNEAKVKLTCVDGSPPSWSPHASVKCSDTTVVGPEKSSSGLSAWIIAVIVIAAVLLMVGILGSLRYFLKKKEPKKPSGGYSDAERAAEQGQPLRQQPPILINTGNNSNNRQSQATGEPM